jgi:hypothetical protein
MVVILVPGNGTVGISITDSSSSPGGLCDGGTVARKLRLEHTIKILRTYSLQFGFKQIENA